MPDAHISLVLEPYVTHVHTQRGHVSAPAIAAHFHTKKLTFPHAVAFFPPLSQARLFWRLPRNDVILSQRLLVISPDFFPPLSPVRIIFRQLPCVFSVVFLYGLTISNSENRCSTCQITSLFFALRLIEERLSCDRERTANKPR